VNIRSITPHPTIHYHHESPFRMSELDHPSEVIEIADQLELRVIDLESGETRRYKSSVVDIAADRFAVSIPTDHRVPVAVPDGTTLVVAIWKDFADHLFKSRVLGKKGGKVPQLFLSKPAPEQIRRTPRREYFRIDTKIPTKIHLVEGKEQTTLPAVMTDLSGGGCRLQTTRHLAADSSLQLDFHLPFPPDKDDLDRTKPLRQVGGIVRLSTTPADLNRQSRAKQSIHLIGVEFGKLDNVVRNSLLRYVAFRQREILNQLQEGKEGEKKPPAEEVEEIEERLDELERDLREAGEEVPQAAPVPTPSEAAAQSDQQPSPADEPFTIALSRQQEEISTQTAEPPPPPSLQPSASGKTILLVEDEEPLREVLAEGLRQQGHTIVEAGNGKEALDLALRTRIDLIITDLMMPKMNGWRLMAALRERGLDVPVIIITAYMNQEGQEVLTSKDISSFLVKPIDLDEMATMVDDVLTGPKIRKPRIMAVDDEEDTRLLVSACLGKAGFDVEVASGGKAALARIGKFRPDLMLLDIAMPEMDGFEVCRRLRAQPTTANLPVILLTAKSSPEYVKKAVTLKINGYVVKPFKPKTLLERIRKTLHLVAST
jgi:CheY-like chemotaxis protein/c-di-GMP-binding flagellar brake protein YcgR